MTEPAPSAPRVTIGLPVHNGEDFLAQAVESLLSQTYRDFELIVSDNASSDRTEEICRSYAARDARVRYHRHLQNVGAARNHNRVVELSRGTYFMWAAHDDCFASEYIARCLEVLDRDSEVVLCYAKASDVDERDHVLPPDNPHRLRSSDERLATSSRIPHVRFRDLIRMDHQCEAVYGLIRADVLRRTPLHGNYADADRVLLSELGLRGRFHLLAERLFVHREHPHRSVNVHPGRHDRSIWMDPRNAGRILLPHFRQFRELLACIHRVPLAWRDRLASYGHMMKWLLNNRRRLSGDLVFAAKEVIRRLLPLLSAPESHGWL